MSLRALCAGALLAFAVAPQAWAADDTLAPTGTLRAAFIAQNVAQGRVDPATGQASGVVGVGRPEEVASVALLLASDAGAFVTGQTIVVDGGTTISDGS